MKNRSASKIVEITPELMRTLPDLFQIGSLMGAMLDVRTTLKISIALGKILEVYFLCATVASYRRRMQEIMKSSLKHTYPETMASVAAISEIFTIESDGNQFIFRGSIDNGCSCIGGVPFKSMYAEDAPPIRVDGSGLPTDISQSLQLRLISPYVKGIVAIPNTEEQKERGETVFKDMPYFRITSKQEEERRKTYDDCINWINRYIGIILPHGVSCFTDDFNPEDSEFWLDNMVKAFTGIDLNATPEYKIALSCIHVDQRLSGSRLEDVVRDKIKKVADKVHTIQEFRTISPRMLPSNDRITLQYKSGARVLCNARLSNSREYLILEPKDTDGAYYIFDGRLSSREVVSVRDEEYIRLYHSDENTKTVHEFLKS